MLSPMPVRLALAALSAALLCACGSSSARPTGSSTSSSTSATATAAPVTATARCGPSGARTLAVDRRARVYALGDSVYGCAGGARSGYRLGLYVSCLRGPRVGPFALAGSLVAYGDERCGVDTGRTSVLVRRLTDGHQLAGAPALSVPLGPESYVTVTSIVLESDGHAAWIAAGRAIVAGHSATAVMALDGQGVHQLDRGTGISPGSLQWHGHIVRWRDGGRWRTARLA
jgi:hypothetical protein